MLTTIGVIILAGGKRALREREAPNLPKLLELINGKPVLQYVLEAAQGIRRAMVSSITAVISTRYEEPLREFFLPHNVHIAVQHTHHGTADAIWQSVLQGVYPDTDYLLVLMGDQPLITAEDLDEFVACMQQEKKRAAILTFEESRENPDFKKCGVVQRDADGRFLDVKARTPIPLKQKELLHAGPYLFETSWLRGLLKVISKYHLQHADDAPNGICMMRSMPPKKTSASKSA